MPKIERLQKIDNDEDGYQAAGLLIDAILSDGEDDTPNGSYMFPTHIFRDENGAVIRVVASVRARPGVAQTGDHDELVSISVA